MVENYVSVSDLLVELVTSVEQAKHIREGLRTMTGQPYINTGPTAELNIFIFARPDV